MKKILVTGASGFLARQVLEPLTELGFQVHAVSRNQKEPEKNIVWHNIDLFSQDQRIELFKKLKPEYLLHSAWFTEHGKFWDAMENLQWIAVSVDILRAFKAYGGKRILAVGSCAEYDWNNPGDKPWREDRKLDPITLYGEAKNSFHKLLHEFSASNGLSYAWARLFLLFGPHEPLAKLVPSVINSLIKNEPANVSSGKQTRDFIDVRDAGEALAQILNSELEGAINICSGMPVTVACLVNMLGEISGKPDLIRLGALPDRENEPSYMVGDNSRLINELDFKLPNISKRLEETFLWWKNRLLH